MNENADLKLKSRWEYIRKVGKDLQKISDQVLKNYKKKDFTLEEYGKKLAEATQDYCSLNLFLSALHDEGLFTETRKVVHQLED